MNVVRVLPDVSGINKTFDYAVPPRWASVIRVGSLVRVDLNGRRVAGWVVEVDPENELAFAAAIPEAVKVGVVLVDPIVVLGDIEIDLDEIGAAWRDGEVPNRPTNNDEVSA